MTFAAPPNPQQRRSHDQPIAQKKPTRAPIARTTRRDGEPVRPGMGTTRVVSRARQSATEIGTRSAETIRASGPKHRVNRPDTRRYLNQSPCRQKILATREPSTQDIREMSFLYQGAPESGDLGIPEIYQSVASTRLPRKCMFGFGVAWRMCDALCWKAHGDGCADADFALQIQGTAMHLDKRLGKRQTKAGPFVFAV